MSPSQKKRKTRQKKPNQAKMSLNAKIGHRQQEEGVLVYKILYRPNCFIIIYDSKYNFYACILVNLHYVLKYIVTKKA